MYLAAVFAFTLAVFQNIYILISIAFATLLHKKARQLEASTLQEALPGPVPLRLQEAGRLS